MKPNKKFFLIPKMQSKFLNQPGISLVEIMVAISIVGIGILGAMAVLFICNRQVEENYRMSLAMFAAEEKMNRVVLGIKLTGSEPAESIMSLNNQYFDVPGLPFYRLKSEPFDAKPGRVEIDDTTDTRMFYITITVVWPIPGSTDQRSQLVLRSALAK